MMLPCALKSFCGPATLKAGYELSGGFGGRETGLRLQGPGAAISVYKAISKRGLVTLRKVIR